MNTDSEPDRFGDEELWFGASALVAGEGVKDPATAWPFDEWDTDAIRGLESKASTDQRVPTPSGEGRTTTTTTTGHDGGPSSPRTTTGTTMTSPTRESRLIEAFVTSADTLVTEFDLVEFLQTLVETSVDLFDADASGLLFADSSGQLQLIASSSEDAKLVELAQLGAIEGPCVDSYRTGRAVSVPDIGAAHDSWPAFAEAAAEHGFHAVHATPMRVRDTTLGAMNLFSSRTGALNPEDISAVQALTDVATVGLLQERLIRRSHTVASQLQTALTTRVAIEQAKGVLAATDDITPDVAFTRMRRHARSTNTPLHDVARRIVDRTLVIPATR